MSEEEALFEEVGGREEPLFEGAAALRPPPRRGARGDVERPLFQSAEGTPRRPETPERRARTPERRRELEPALRTLLGRLRMEGHAGALLGAGLGMRHVCRANAEDWSDIGIEPQAGEALRRAAREVEGLAPDPEPEPEPEPKLSLEPVGPREEVILPVTFDQPGKLGIRFRAKRDDVRDELAWVDQVLPGGLADKDGRIVPGLVLVAINGAAAADMTFAEQTSVQRLGVRPLELGFRPAEGEVQDFLSRQEGRQRELAAADLVDTACQVAADRPANNEAVRTWKQRVVAVEQDLRAGVELTEPSAAALLERAKALMDQLKQSLAADPTVRAAIFLYEPTIQNNDDYEEPIHFKELQARVAAAQASSAAFEWLQEHPVDDAAAGADVNGREATPAAEFAIGSGHTSTATASGPIAAIGTLLSDEQLKTVRNVVAAWVEETVLRMPIGVATGGQRSQPGQGHSDDNGRVGALLWRCCGITMRSWLPGSTALEATLASIRDRSQSELPFEIRRKLVADDGWQSAVDELNRMDGDGQLGVAAAAATAVPRPDGALELVDPPLPPAEMLSTVLQAVAAIYAAPTSTASKLDAIGADDLMPVLSFVLAQCSVGGDLGICAEWIQQLADPPLLADGQPAYYFITFCSALDYLGRYRDQPDPDTAAGQNGGSGSGSPMHHRATPVQLNASVHGMGAEPGTLSTQSVRRRGVIECGLLLAHFANISTPTPRRRPQKMQQQHSASPADILGSSVGPLASATTDPTGDTLDGSVALGTPTRSGIISPSSRKNFRDTVTEIFGHRAGCRAEPLEFQEPSDKDKNCDGKLLIGKRVYVDGIGVGELTDFHKVLHGSSSHSLTLETDGRVVVTKLQRKMCPKPKQCGCCPDKLPWLIARPRSIAPETPVPEGIPPEPARRAPPAEDAEGRPNTKLSASGAPTQLQQDLLEERQLRNILGVCTVVKRRLTGVALRAAPAESSAEVGRLGPGEQAMVIRIGPGPNYEPWDSDKHGGHWVAGLKVSHRPVVRTLDGWLTLLPDTLVARTEPLALPMKEWANNESSHDCTGCQTEFGVWVRRHHCRYCGQVFCDDCSPNRYPLASHERLDAASPETRVDERVCTNCLMFLQSWINCVQSPFAPDDFEDIQMCSLENSIVDMRTPLGPESYEPLCVLGIGGVGKVFLAQLKDCDQEPHQLWAVKTMNKQQLVQRNQHIHAMEEMRLMRKLTEERSGCPYLLPLSAAFHTDETLFLVMPFMQGGDLHQAIGRQQNKKLDEAAVRFIAAEITLALEALHSLDIVFRDLKPMNVLLTTAGHVQLSDFGLAKEGVSRSVTQTTCGTPLYMSPEQVQHATMAMMHEEQVGGYSFAVDWWALGTLIFEALTGQPPFVARQMGNIMHKIANKEHSFPAEDQARLSDDAMAIVAALLQKDADRRLGAEGTADVQAHPWFVSHIDFDALGRMELPPVYVPLPTASLAANATDTGGSTASQNADTESTSSGLDAAHGGDKKKGLSALLGCFDLEITRAPVDRTLFKASDSHTARSMASRAVAESSTGADLSPSTAPTSQQGGAFEHQQQGEFWIDYTYMSENAGAGS